MKRPFGSPGRDWLDPDNFGCEPLYCAAPQTKDDILCPGSDDEAYDSPTERRTRCEAQARRFLDGKPVFLLSASLRGPFDRESGWVNPWRSKSTPASRTKPALRKRSSAQTRSNRAAEQHEPSGILESSNCPQDTTDNRIASPPVALHIFPRYLDDHAFHRVCDWRDQVVAETDVATSQSQQDSQTQPPSADSRRATQYTTRRRSGMTVDTLDGGLINSPPSTPRVVDDVQGQATSEAPSVDGQMESIQTTASQNLPTAAAPRVAHSPRSVNSPERPILSVRTTQPPSLNRIIEESTPTVKVEAVDISEDKENLETANATPYGISLQETASAALFKIPASARTDGSFRYRRKPGQEKTASLEGSKLGASPSAPSYAEQRPSPCDLMPQEEALETEDPAPLGAVTSSDSAMPIKLEPIEGPDVPGQESSQGLPQPDLSENLKEPEDRAPGETRSQEEENMQANSQIDGPTLVPSPSRSCSESPSMPSFGHFSCENHSQDVVACALGLPRRLLWPKSQRSGSGGPLSLFGPESTRTPVSEPAIKSRSSSPPSTGLGVQKSVFFKLHPRRVRLLLHEQTSR
jgi:hypothetical protein